MQNNPPNSLISSADRCPENSYGDYEVTTPLISSLFVRPSLTRHTDRESEEISEKEGYIQVGTTNACNKIRRVIHRHGLQPQHPSPRSCNMSMWSDVSTSHESNSKAEIEQQLADNEGKEKERKSAGVRRVPVSLECMLEREYGKKKLQISDRFESNTSRSPSPVTSSERKRTYSRLIASDIPIQSTVRTKQTSFYETISTTLD